jgi:hypothetical protein
MWAMKTRKVLSIITSILFYGLLFSLLSGCGSACKDLANKVCDCQPTRAKEDRCHRSIDAASSNFDLSDEEEDACQAILDSGECTCEAIEAGNFAACGLSYDPAQE